MANAANIFNNTILIPTSGSPEDTPKSTFGKALQTYNQKNDNETIKTGEFRIFLNVKGNSIPMKYCSSIFMVEVRREAEPHRSGGNGLYIAKVPGPLSYTTIEFVHFYCSTEPFLDWLINGIDQGGVQTANFEIKVGHETDHMVYTLRDAIPVGWNLGTFSIDFGGAARTGELVAYMINESQILCENLTVAYSRMDIDHETSSWGN